MIGLSQKRGMLRKCRLPCRINRIHSMVQCQNRDWSPLAAALLVEVDYFDMLKNRCAAQTLWLRSARASVSATLRHEVSCSSEIVLATR